MTAEESSAGSPGDAPRPGAPRVRARSTRPPRVRPAPRVTGDGLWLARKSAGLSSRQSLDRVARAFGRRDMGHAGTLDPFATGLLLLLAGQATRLVPWIQAWDKEYAGVVRLGVATDSLDATGNVTATGEVPPLTLAEVRHAAAGLVGSILQAPPMYSAAHAGGERLYELARRGIEIEREARPRVVSAFDIQQVEGPVVSARIVCSSGTYVRVLAEALGAALGLPAHLAALERTRIGPWHLADALADDAFDALDAGQIRARCLGLAEILPDWPSHVLTPGEAVIVRHGRLPVPGFGEGLPVAPGLKLLDEKGRLVALAARSEDETPRLLRVFAVTGGGELS